MGIKDDLKDAFSPAEAGVALTANELYKVIFDLSKYNTSVDMRFKGLTGTVGDVEEWLLFSLDLKQLDLNLQRVRKTMKFDLYLWTYIGHKLQTEVFPTIVKVNEQLSRLQNIAASSEKLMGYYQNIEIHAKSLSETMTETNARYKK